MKNNKILVLTVGLKDEYQKELGVRLGTHEEIETRHLDAWTFTVSNADILILNVDSDAGQETMSMLRSFRGPNDPIVVTFSESDDRMHAWRGKGAHPEDTPEDIIPGFCKRLETALQKSGCLNAHLDPLERTQPSDSMEDGKKTDTVVTGMRWAG